MFDTFTFFLTFDNFDYRVFQNGS